MTFRFRPSRRGSAAAAVCVSVSVVLCSVRYLAFATSRAPFLHLQPEGFGFADFLGFFCLQGFFYYYYLSFFSFWLRIFLKSVCEILPCHLEGWRTAES